MVAVHAFFEGHAMRRIETREAGERGSRADDRANLLPENDDRELQDLAAAYGPRMPAAFLSERALLAA